MGLLAGVVALTLGRRIARRSRVVAILTSGLLPSITFVLVEEGLFAAEMDVHGDGPAMALAGSMILSVLVLPATLAIAAIVVMRQRPMG